MAIVAAIPEIIPPLIKALPQIVSAVITNLISKLGDLFGGLWDGIVNIFKGAGKWFGDIFKNAFNGIKNAFSGVANFFSGIWNSIKNIFSKVGSAIAGAITNTVKSAINGVLSTAIKIINGFISAINIAIGVINLIPGVEISKLSKLSVPKLARGGIVDNATLAVVGEQGKEAIVPLENNTEWIDMLVEKLGGSRGASTPIILQVDGKTFAQTTISSINDLTRQTGKLPLVLV
jgi:phage-related protein